MSREEVLAVLDELLTLERRSLAARVLESGVFLTRSSVGELAAVHAMADASDHNAHRLSAAIESLGGVPGLRRGDLTTADLHFQSLEHVASLLPADCETMIEQYERAIDLVADEPEAARLVGALIEGHRDRLAAARAKHADTASEGV